MVQRKDVAWEVIVVADRLAVEEDAHNMEGRAEEVMAVGLCGRRKKSYWLLVTNQGNATLGMQVLRKRRSKTLLIRVQVLSKRFLKPMEEHPRIIMLVSSWTWGSPM
jgi:hypothetical protein